MISFAICYWVLRLVLNLIAIGARTVDDFFNLVNAFLADLYESVENIKDHAKKEAVKSQIAYLENLKSLEKYKLEDERTRRELIRKLDEKIKGLEEVSYV